jgi:hypothetical protein
MEQGPVDHTPLEEQQQHNGQASIASENHKLFLIIVHHKGEKQAREKARESRRQPL